MLSDILPLCCLLCSN